MKNIPKPPKMIRREYDVILEKAMKKIENGEPLNIDLPPMVAYDTPMTPKDMEQFNEMMESALAYPEGVVVYHTLKAIRDGRPPTSFVDESLPEDDVLIIARMLQARKEAGPKDKNGNLTKLASVPDGARFIVDGKLKKNPRPKERAGASKDKEKRADAVRSEYYSKPKNLRDDMEVRFLERERELAERRTSRTKR